MVDEPILDMVYRWLSLNAVVDRSEKALLRALKQEAGMVRLELSASEVSLAIFDVARINSSLAVRERVARMRI